MDMDQAAVFLAGSILTALGFIVVIGAMVVINNLLHKFWKPVRIFSADSWHINPPVYDREEPKIEPSTDSTTNRVSKQK
jgi:hypothetical protein